MDREKVISEFEDFVKSFSKRDDTYYKGLFISVLALLKEQNGLMLALEQSNAVNEYLNAEIERLNGLLKKQGQRIEAKEAEPRLLTPEEVQAMEAGTPLVVERFIKHNGKVVPMACWAIHTGSLILSFHGTMFPDTVHEIPYVTIVQNREGKGHHNEYYRFWSDMPTREQMKQEEWKGIEGDGC